MKKKILFIVLVQVIFNSCEDRKKVDKITQVSNIEKINVDLSKKQKVSFSDIYSSIKYVKLETDPENVLGEIQKLEIHDDQFYIHAEKSLNIFSSNGRLIKSLSEVGDGIGEFKVLSDFYIDELKKIIFIYDSKSKKILKYDYQGNYLEEIQINLDGYSFTKFEDGKFAVYIGSGLYNKITTARVNIVDETGKIVKKFIPITEKESYFLHIADLTNFQSFQNITSFLYGFNDTIYKLNSDSMAPRFVIDFGDNKLPKKYLEQTYNDVREFLESCKKTNFAYQVIGFFETNIALVFAFRHKYDVLHVYYSKKSKKMFIVNELENDFLFSDFSVKTKYKNLPKAANNNHYYTLQDTFNFISIVDSIKNSLSIEQWELYKKKNGEILSIYEESDINDNPLIMIGKVKEF